MSDRLPKDDCYLTSPIYWPFPMKIVHNNCAEKRTGQQFYLLTLWALSLVAIFRYEKSDCGCGGGSFQTNHCASPLSVLLDCVMARWMGAGCQCRDPTFCALSVFCPLFDHLLSNYCPQFALVLSLSCFCLLFFHQFPTFVYPSCSFCPPLPLFGLHLSTFLTQILEKIIGQKLVKKWTHFFINLPPGHPVTG